jgi:hypothetical protein
LARFVFKADGNLIDQRQATVSEAVSILFSVFWKPFQAETPALHAVASRPESFEGDSEVIQFTAEQKGISASTFLTLTP